MFLPFSLNQAVGAVGADDAAAGQKIDELIVKYKGSAPRVIKYNGENINRYILDLKQDKNIEYVEPNYTYKAAIIPSDPYYNNQWYLQKIKAPRAWEVNRESPKIVIAIIDSGVQTDNPDLKNNIWINKKEIAGNGLDDDKNGFVDDANGWDFVDNTNNPNPKFEGEFTNDALHGTIVAGIAAAEGNNATGITGVSWKAQIMPLRVLNDKGEGKASNVIKAIDYAINNGADIINLSFVGFNYSQGMDEAIKRAFDRDIIVVAAAGNESNKTTDEFLNNKPMYPVCLDGRPGENRVIGVAATDAMDQKTYFSGYGSRCVDIAAPGISIYSTTVYDPTHILNGQVLNKYYDGYWSGTSVATPIISGSLALIEATNPKYNRKQVINTLLNNADNINRLNPKYLNQLGHGRVNLEMSLIDAKLKLGQTREALILSPQSNRNATSTLRISNQEGKVQNEITPFENSGIGISVATGDVDGDGEVEIIAAHSKDGNPEVRIFSQSGKLKSRFMAYRSNFKGGVNLAVADVDGDGIAEIITGAGPGGGPHVRVFNSKGKLKAQFFAFDKNFTGGVNIAAGDVDANHKAEIIAAAQSNASPQVRIFNGKGMITGQFYAFEKNYRGGVRLAVGDIDGGIVNKKVEIIASTGESHAPEIRIYGDHGELRSKFLAYDKNFTNGVSITSTDINKDGIAEIITGAGPGGGPHVRVFDSKGKLLNSFYSFENDYSGGVNVSSLEQ